MTLSIILAIFDSAHMLLLVFLGYGGRHVSLLISNAISFKASITLSILLSGECIAASSWKKNKLESTAKYKVGVSLPNAMLYC